MGMDIKKLIIAATPLFIILILLSCDPPPCTVQIYELEPVRVKLYLGIPDTVYYQHGVLLLTMKSDTSIVKDSIFVNDTLKLVDRVVVTNSCEMNISEKNYKLKQSDTIFFGNKEAGGTYSKLKYSCDRFDFKTQSVDISVWKTRFIQDCSNWNEK
jgi:hypothetical protein